MAVVGVDEAGKGPVLGSMFAAAVRWSAGHDASTELDDSKALSAERRAAIADRLRSDETVDIALTEVPVDRIDAPETDMNALTLDAHAEAAGAVVRPGDIVRCDAADVDADRFGRRLEAALREIRFDGLDVRAEHRADKRHPVVSAASVIAKVTRDAHIDELAADYGHVGSGYPSDPTTMAFLEDFVSQHGRLPTCARASWETSRRALAGVEQSGLDDF